MKRVVKVVLVSMLLCGVGVAVSPSSADAATATVANGITTTDLNAVGMSAASLAASLVGPGVSVSNATFTGSNIQAGTVHVQDPAVVSFNDGVIMSSGNIADVVGPNKSESTTTDVNGPGDPSLDQLIQSTQTVVPATYDAASLQFDFTPTTNHVYFTYVFGSDEYLEWVNLYNDVFGFFVNGQNCATTSTGQPVSIDTINSAVNSNLYRDNSFLNPPASPINIEPDGLTVEMICSANVNAGQVNHMKLAIADTSDHILDSVVMLKAQSLSVVPPESCNNGVDDNGDGKVDMNDPLCQATTTPPPTGNSGIGSGSSAPPFTGSEGSPIPLDASTFGWKTTVDTVSTTWQVTGINGTPGTCNVTPGTAQAPNLDGSIAVVHAVCPNEGEYVAHVWGWDGPGGTGGSTFDYDVDFFVHNAPPAVTISTPTPGTQVAVGEAVHVAASVTDPGLLDTATCTIDWGDGNAVPASLSAGICSGSHAYGAAGSSMISVTATDNAGASGAAASMVTVVPNSGGLPSVTSNPTDVTVATGQPFSFSANATGSPVPDVQWQLSGDNGATWSDVVGATNNTVSGTATLAYGGLQFRAVFTNTSGAATTSTATLSVTGTEVAVASSNPHPVVGQSVTLTATVTDAAKASSAIAGKISFYDGTTSLGSKSFLSGGTASLATTKLGQGTHAITAVWAATSKSTKVTSPALALAIGKASTTVTLAASPTKGTSSTTFSFTASVKVVAPGKAKAAPGTVIFYDGAAQIGSVAFASGTSAKLSIMLPTGSHSITAIYQGNSDLQASLPSNVRTVAVS